MSVSLVNPRCVIGFVWVKRHNKRQTEL